MLDTEPAREDDTEVDGDVSARRIASEAASVQIMTVWAAKGLEFPVVCLPTLWRPPREQRAGGLRGPRLGAADLRPVRRSGLARRGGGAGPLRLAADESAGERLRLLYVAMTRAQHQTVVWWAQAGRSARVRPGPCAVRPPRGGHRSARRSPRRRSRSRPTGRWWPTSIPWWPRPGAPSPWR